MENIAKLFDLVEILREQIGNVNSNVVAMRSELEGLKRTEETLLRKIEDLQGMEAQNKVEIAVLKNTVAGQQKLLWFVGTAAAGAVILQIFKLIFP